MSTLGQDELRVRIAKGQLIRNPRRTVEGAIDLQPASYDLSAGHAVWSEPQGTGDAVKEAQWNAAATPEAQPTVTLQPGQMMSIMTLEDLVIPRDLCATVYSRNSLALKGIFAFNAGHVDPGYDGPIVIRLINLRVRPFTITLGEAIFTVVFHHIQTHDTEYERLPGRQPVTRAAMIKRVRDFADVALSNALFDLYAQQISKRLDEHRGETLRYLQSELDKEFVKQEKLGPALLKWGWAKILLIAGSVALFLTIVRHIIALVGLAKGVHTP
jgi:deoxycytidine triphosphate deaminase